MFKHQNQSLSVAVRDQPEPYPIFEHIQPLYTAEFFCPWLIRQQYPLAHLGAFCPMAENVGARGVFSLDEYPRPGKLQVIRQEEQIPGQCTDQLPPEIIKPA